MIIEFKNVTKKNKKITILNKISFKIKKGEIVGFLGPNGAGKTTTMRMILGLLKPTNGEIFINDRNQDNADLLDFRKEIGYLSEDNPLYLDFKVFEYLKFISQVKKVDDNKILRKVIIDCGLQEVISKKIDYLSKGYRQRVGIAVALLGDPEILILDEPTVGLDPNQVIEIRKLIKDLALKKTIIFSTHVLSEVQNLCQKIIFINKGQIVATGSLKKLTKGKSLEKIFQKLTS